MTYSTNFCIELRPRQAQRPHQGRSREHQGRPLPPRLRRQVQLLWQQEPTREEQARRSDDDDQMKL